MNKYEIQVQGDLTVDVEGRSFGVDPDGHLHIFGEGDIVMGIFARGEWKCITDESVPA